MKREERVDLYVRLARGVKAIKKVKHVKGAEVHYVELAPDEDVYTVPPSESALLKLTEYTDGKLSTAKEVNRKQGIVVEVLEADVVDDVASTSPAAQAEPEAKPQLAPLEDAVEEHETDSGSA